MVDMGDRTKAIGIIESFTAIMKYILAYEDRTIFIFEELKFIEDYIALQRYRYGDQFTFTMKCDDSIINHKILRMIIQPLIENAILHGTSDGIETVNIVLDIKEEDNLIKIIVSDDGAGMSSEVKSSLWKSEPNDAKSNLIGMKNISDRIKLFYGSDYNLEIVSELGKGVTIITTIPKKI